MQVLAKNGLFGRVLAFPTFTLELPLLKPYFNLPVESKLLCSSTWISSHEVCFICKLAKYLTNSQNDVWLIFANGGLGSIPKMLCECFKFVESPKIAQKVILLNASTCQKWTFLESNRILNIGVQITIA